MNCSMESGPAEPWVAHGHAEVNAAWGPEGLVGHRWLSVDHKLQDFTLWLCCSCNFYAVKMLFPDRRLVMIWKRRDVEHGPPFDPLFHLVSAFAVKKVAPYSLFSAFSLWPLILAVSLLGGVPLYLYFRLLVVQKPWNVIAASPKISQIHAKKLACFHSA